MSEKNQRDRSEPAPATDAGLEALDAEIRRALDDTTQLAALLCGVSAAWIVLQLDGELRCASRVGTDEGVCRNARPFDERVVSSRENLLIPDISAELPAHPLVAERSASPLRFYAGVPLLDSRRHALGALCVTDSQARRLETSRIEALETLAVQAAAQIELRREVAHLGQRLRDQQLTADDRHRLFDLSLDLFCVAGFDGYFKRLNPAWETTLGYSREELLARRFIEFVHPEDRQRTMDEAEKLGGGVTTVHFENRYLARDGSHRWLLWTASPLPERRLIYAAARDITARKQIEEARRLSDQRFRALIESAPDAILLVDRGGSIVSANRRVGNLFGYSQRELLGRSVDLLLPEAVRERHRGQRFSYFRDPVPRGMGTGLDLTARHKDGSEIPVDVSLGPIETESGMMVAATITDVTERRRADEALRQANQELQARVLELQQLSHEARLLSEMGEMLQSCRSVEETYTVIDVFARDCFRLEPGAVFLVSSSRNLMEKVSSWGGDSSGEVFETHDCWAMRRGRVHRIFDAGPGVVCPHVDEVPPQGYRCVPMLAQGESLGVLHLRHGEPPPHEPADRTHELDQARERLAVGFAEHVALALANLRLRESLRAQSIRDPLTGLFNRRYMEESLERELSRAERNRSRVGVIMIDLDHFKRLNDTQGHDAGDAVLVELGRFLRSYTRNEDILCRFGGEEFVIILPDASLEVTQRRAEQLREQVHNLKVRHRNTRLDTVTLSAGVACFPEHGTNKGALLRAADGALYRAKDAGRDQVAVAAGIESSDPLSEIERPAEPRR